ncbi:hypothetical protein WA026_005932 [Henosepilachna vigintioctopunctata]|uniref:Condensin II complex subunit H2 N-terminal domain-containing protein n=1 Tax=Henosepilachna vigintioctopunctata TaxID=420089 RepID=A0AAW1TU94_9CUCU
MDTYQEDEHVNSNSKLGKLIIKVNNMQKKPLLDDSLSEVLDVFLQKLRQSEDFLINGIFQINFAEAALLLQSSAFIYCKKVDLLWDSINQCQKRMIAFDSEENKVELLRLEEREKSINEKGRLLS